MAEDNMCESICKSIFKSGESSTNEQDMTNMWADLINTIEKGKNVDSCAKVSSQYAQK